MEKEHSREIRNIYRAFLRAREVGDVEMRDILGEAIAAYALKHRRSN